MVSALLIGNHLAASGRNPTVSEELAVRLRADGMNVLTTSQRANKILRLGDMLTTAWLRQQRYDVAQIDVYSGPAFLWAEAVASVLTALAKPFVLSLHGGNLPAFSRSHRNRFRRLLRGAWHVTCPSAYLQREFSSIRADIEVVPNPLDTAAYRVDPWRKAHRAPRVVWLRGFHRIYSPQTAIAAFARVHEHSPAATLAMYGPDLGDGTYLEARELAMSLGLGKAVLFPGPVAKSDVPRILATANAFLNTSMVDNAPVSLVEAMAAGVPVVSSDCGGIPDLIEHGESGLLAEAGDISGFSDAITRVLGSPKLAGELSTQAARRAASFDWRHVLPRWRAILKQASRQ